MLVQTLINMVTNYCFGFSEDMHLYSAMSEFFEEGNFLIWSLLLLGVGGQTSASGCSSLITQDYNGR